MATKLSRQRIESIERYIMLAHFISEAERYMRLSQRVESEEFKAKYFEMAEAASKKASTIASGQGK